MRVVPPLDEVEHCHARLGLGFETGAVEQFAFQGGEKTFAHGVVKTVAHRAHRRPYAGLVAAFAKSERGVPPICAEHELFGDDALDTATNQRCYVCRKPVPTSRENAKDGRWRDIRFGGIAIGALCADCCPKPRGQSLDPSEGLALAESA